MDPLAFEIDGAPGYFFWCVLGEPESAFGPVVPALFRQFRDNAGDRALLTMSPLSKTCLLWASDGDPSSDEVGSVRLVGTLPQIEGWGQCEAWLQSVRDRDALERGVGDAPPRPARRRL